MSDTLELASNEELVTELFKRFEDVLLVTTALPKNDDHSSCKDISVTFKGGAIAAIGLSVVSKDFLKDIVRRSDDDEEEE